MSASICEWVVWYDDGRSFSDDDGPPENAPRWGVICAVGYDRSGSRSIQHARDYYGWSDGQWLAMDHTGLIDYLANQPGREKIVLMGRMVPNAVFYPIYERAHNDPRTPQ